MKKQKRECQRILAPLFVYHIASILPQSSFQSLSSLTTLKKVGVAVSMDGDPTGGGASGLGKGRGGRHRWRPYGAGKWLDIANDCMK